MTWFLRILASALGLASAGCFMPSGSVTRTLERSFQVAPGSVVAVRISGGAIASSTGPAGVARLTLRQEVFVDSDRNVDDVLADYEVAARQQGDTVTLTGRRRPGSSRHVGWLDWSGGVHFSATIEVPSDVRLDLGTSGGDITVRGDRTAALQARTSGGSVAADGGLGELSLSTSGGTIDVGRALGSLNARTSGGSIRVGYVGPSSSFVALQTSGGSIDADVDRAARLDVAAETSGGDVSLEGLSGVMLEQDRSRGRSHFSGRMNGGGSPLRARTSGGSIVIRGTGDSPASLSSRPIETEPAMRRRADRADVQIFAEQVGATRP